MSCLASMLLILKFRLHLGKNFFSLHRNSFPFKKDSLINLSNSFPNSHVYYLSMYCQCCTSQGQNIQIWFKFYVTISFIFNQSQILSIRKSLSAKTSILFIRSGFLWFVKTVVWCLSLPCTILCHCHFCTCDRFIHLSILDHFYSSMKVSLTLAGVHYDKFWTDLTPYGHQILLKRLPTPSEQMSAYINR